MNPPLTLALITKNEAANLADCLNSARPLNCRTVIIDSGSSDHTAEIAARFGAEFYTHSDWQGFGIQRNRVRAYIENGWILWLDADERLTPELCRSILAAVENTPADGKTAFAFNRLSNTFGAFIRHCGWSPDWVVRLYPAAHARYSDDLLHEKVMLPENCRTVRLQGDCLHYTYTTLEQFLHKQNLYSCTWAEQRLRNGKRCGLGSALLHGFGSFVRMYFLKAGFLDGRHGLLLSVLSAQSAFNKYAALWLMGKGSPPPANCGPVQTGTDIIMKQKEKSSGSKKISASPFCPLSEAEVRLAEAEASKAQAEARLAETKAKAGRFAILCIMAVMAAGLAFVAAMAWL